MSGQSYHLINIKQGYHHHSSYWTFHHNYRSNLRVGKIEIYQIGAVKTFTRISLEDKKWDTWCQENVCVRQASYHILGTCICTQPEYYYMLIRTKPNRNYKRFFFLVTLVKRFYLETFNFQFFSVAALCLSWVVTNN